MAIPTRIEFPLDAIITEPAIAPMITANLTKGLFHGNNLALPQSSWYVPDPIATETLIEVGAAATNVSYGDRFYAFSAKAEPNRAAEIELILKALIANNPTVTVWDYCCLGGGGTLVTDGDERQYKLRTGRLTLEPPQSPGIGATGRVVYTEPMEFRFEPF
ncbi:MAG: hypothetical protein F6J87_06090 [Spirulina sp. SIO3F2]|nr:hypothetical protein [Spirulina sp. SIO3F2]